MVPSVVAVWTFLLQVLQSLPAGNEPGGVGAFILRSLMSLFFGDDSGGWGSM